jgi:hypothetical protein
LTTVANVPKELGGGTARIFEMVARILVSVFGLLLSPPHLSVAERLSTYGSNGIRHARPEIYKQHAIYEGGSRQHQATANELGGHSWGESIPVKFEGKRTADRRSPLTGANLVVADFNGDGRADWLDFDESCSYTMGMGSAGPESGSDGMFRLHQSRIEMDPLWQEKSHIVACDFDGDGRDDFIIVDTDGNHQMGISNGDGDFTPHTTGSINGIAGFATCATGCLNVRGADLNNDGKCDLILMQSDGNHAFFVSNGLDENKEMSFTVHNPLTVDDYDPEGVRGYPALKLSFDQTHAHILADDFDGDGHTDVMNLDSLGFESFVLLWRRQLGAGTGKMKHGRNTGTVDVYDVTAVPDHRARKDKDGIRGIHGYRIETHRHEEIEHAHLVQEKEGVKAGEYLDSPGSNEPCGVGCSHVLTGDFNGDGMADVIVLQADGNHALFESKGTRRGKLSFERYHPIPSLDNIKFAKDSINGRSKVQVVDLNGDGYSDILILDSDGRHSMATSNGDGSFREYPAICAVAHTETVNGIIDEHRPHCEHSSTRYGIPGLAAYAPPAVHPPLAASYSQWKSTGGDLEQPGLDPDVVQLANIHGVYYYNQRTQARGYSVESVSQVQPVDGSGGGEWWLRVGDFNGDGMSEFVVLQKDGNHLFVRNKGNKILVPPAVHYDRFSRTGRYDSPSGLGEGVGRQTFGNGAGSQLGQSYGNQLYVNVKLANQHTT